ncbi:ABC transporter permease [Streptosporangium oxazolinicum]|uniref:ABC transporter permease n=1 Tax=Streptosporangium oxazolinicum TaxID=909287 RepID=A0ABP8AIQ7_9ACTN
MTMLNGERSGETGHGEHGTEPLDAVAATMSPRARATRRALSSSPFYMALVLLGLVVVFVTLAPGTFPTTANARNIVNDAATLLVMAVGMTFVMVAAGFDLSIGSVLVFGGICGSKTMTWLGTDDYWTILAGLVASMAGGLAWGLFNGFCVTRLRVPALIATLGSMGAALGVAQLMTNGNDVRDVPLTLIRFSTGSFLGFGYLVWLALAVVIVGGLVLALTRFGRHTYVIGSNEEAARRAGIDVRRHMLKLYALSGLLAGLAGMMSLARFATTTIGGHTQDALEVITGVVLGGTSLFGGAGTIVGTVIGIFVPAVLQNGFVVKNVQPFWQEVAIGFILIAAVYIDQLKRRTRDRT